MKELIKYFPRQLSLPARIKCDNIDEFMLLFKQNNQLKNKIYYSLYNVDKNNSFTNPLIDKIAFDLDSPQRLKKIMQAHIKLKKLNLKHLMIFSTKGFWIYIFTKNYENIIYPKDCLLNTLQYMLKELDLTMGAEKIADTDYHCVDIARVARLPLSYDNDRKRFCISVSEEDLLKGYDYICEKSKKISYNFYYYGENLLDIKQFDKKNITEIKIDIPEYNYDINLKDDLIKDFHPCIKRILTIKGLDTYDNRYWFAVYCKEQGLPKELCMLIAKKYFTTIRTDKIGTNYDHMIKFKVFDYAYNRDDYFLDCDTLFDKNICLGKCNKERIYNGTN